MFPPDRISRSQWIPGLWLALALAALPLYAAELGPVSGVDRAQVLVLGRVSENPRKHFHYLAPMLDYVVERMADLGIREGRVLMARDNKEMLRYLRQGRIDWITETLFSSLVYRQEAGAELLVGRLKEGVPEYHTVFVTRKGSDIEHLDDLKGRVVGLEDPGSTTSFLLPVRAMLEQGLVLERLDNVREEPLADAVNYALAYQEINLSIWLKMGLVDAIAYSDLDWHMDDHTPPVFREGFRIFHRTDPVPRAQEMVRGDLDPAIKLRLKQLLLDAEKDPEAAAALHTYHSTSRFDVLTPELMRRIDEAQPTFDMIQRSIR